MNTLNFALAAAAAAAFAASGAAAQMTGSMPAPAPPLAASPQPAPPIPSHTEPRALIGVPGDANARVASPIAVGLRVNDNTGAAVGQITALSGGPTPMATIKMGERSFQVPAGNLYIVDGAATINLTKAQLQAALPKAPA